MFNVSHKTLQSKPGGLASTQQTTSCFNIPQFITVFFGVIKQAVGWESITDIL